MKFDYLVVAGGVKPSRKLIQKIIKTNPSVKVVAVDRGFDILRALKIRPHLFVGDGDSVQFRGKMDADKVIRLPKDKSISDLEFALKSLPAKSKKLVLAAHKEGARLDHGFTNLLLSLNYKNLIFVDEKSWLTGLINQSFTFNTAPNTLFSVISPFKVALSVKGARYSPRNLILKSPSHGLSNQTLGQGDVEVKVRGRAALFVNGPYKF